VKRAALRIAYVHGFNSGSASFKGRQLAKAIAALPAAVRPEYHLPQLSHQPAQAMRALCGWVESGARDGVTFVGSSLGGFYATHLAERYGTKAVLINPALAPDRDLAPYLGMQSNPYTGETYEVTAQHFAEMSALKVSHITRPERYLLLVQTGDEVLDYRQAIAYYAGAWQFVQGAGDHAFRDFAAQIPPLLRFAGVDPALAGQLSV
jgi:predicted esterase YcpF (UPF0227 family)